MAVTLETNGKRYRGLSTDQKPGVFPDIAGQALQVPPEGSTFKEIDTGRLYVWQSGEWKLQPQTLEALLEESIELQRAILATFQATQRGHELYLWEEQVETLAG